MGCGAFLERFVQMYLLCYAAAVATRLALVGLSWLCAYLDRRFAR